MTFRRTKIEDSEPKRTPCRGCGVPIIFIETNEGHPMPCDPKRVVVVTSEGRTVSGYAPHWATCPAGKKFREPKDKSRGEELSPDDAKKEFARIRGQLDGDEVTDEEF